jgi:ABC-type uncharacterized transport system permease subunit
MPDGNLVLLTGLLASGVRLSMAIGFAAIGKSVAERSGMINVGVEGIMLVGAFLATFGSVATGSPWGGVVLAMIGGGIMAAFHALFVIKLRINQIVSGIRFVILGLGLSGFLYRLTLGATPVEIPSFQAVKLSLLSTLPVIGPALFGQNVLAYVCVALACLVGWFLNRTAFGLQIRACGENPEAARAMGISVSRIRTACIVFGGAMAGLGGAYLAIAQINSFVEDMVARRGFLAIACVVFGRWRPVGALAAAIGFGLAEAAQIRLQTRFPNLPYQFLVMLPYLLATVALVFSSRSSVAPHALRRSALPG